MLIADSRDYISDTCHCKPIYLYYWQRLIVCFCFTCDPQSIGRGTSMTRPLKWRNGDTELFESEKPFKAKNALKIVYGSTRGCLNEAPYSRLGGRRRAYTQVN